MIVKGTTTITKDGTITNRTTNGTFAQGESIIETVARLMMKNGVTLSVITPTEQHKHDDDDPKAHEHVHTS